MRISDWSSDVCSSDLTAVTVPDNRFTLEGRALVIVEAGYTDTDASSVLHVPDLALVVAGDVIYNSAHLYLSETSLAELGRASCRESGCQYVYITVAAVPLQNNNNEAPLSPHHN